MRIWIVLLAMSFFLLAAGITQALNAGCCLNPGAGILACATERLVGSSECCPTPVASNPDYYKPSAGGPSTEQQCLSSFFLEGESCGESDQCLLGCCCSTNSGSIKAKVQCIGNSSNFHAGTTDCITVCAISQCSDGIDNDNNGCADYPSDQGCLTASDITESGGQCVDLTGPNCDNINYVPKITNALLQPIRGQKKLQLSWANECSSTLSSNDIYRCTGNTCTNFQLIGSTPHQTYTDEDSMLKFDTTYSYKIEARFSVQTAKASTIVRGSMGNIECWNKFDSSPFCIHDSYYNQYKQYLIQNIAGFSIQNFLQSVKNTFGARLNKAFTCTTTNVLSGELLACSTGQVCVVSGTTPQCVALSDCNPDQQNLFGLFFTQQICENGNYCFYDRSVSTVDACYSCSTAMSCYDYKSMETCQRDNCKLQNCRWNPITIELGTGVCVDENQDNCIWCDKPGTEGIGSAASTSSVFEQCNDNKALLLSTQNDICYYKSQVGIALNCKDVKCSDYSTTQCLGGVPAYNEFNTLTTKSNDRCNFGTCQIFNDACKKNANEDNQVDCVNDECEADVFAPNTTLVPIIDRGIYKSVAIQILDQSDGRGTPTLRTTNDYKTYFCLEPCGVSGHPYEKLTTSFNLIISNKKLFDSANGQILLTLNENQNTIRYYSEDPAKNIGKVLTVQIIGSNTSTGPVIFRVNITGANNVDGVFYLQNRRPAIEVGFLEDAIITSARLLVQGTNLAIPLNGSTNLQKVHTLTIGNNLNPGFYTLEINAKNDKGIFMDRAFTAGISIDDQPPAITSITPGNNSLIKASPVSVTIIFDSKVILNDIKINNEIVTTLFTSTDKQTFTGKLELSDGNKQMSIAVKDLAGNAATFPNSFVLNANPLTISMQNPPFGVSPSYTFDLTIATDNDASCKFNLDDDLQYEFMTSFDSTGGTVHARRNFNAIPDGDKLIHALFVRCDDPQQGPKLQIFDLSVDVEPPVIKTAFAFPNPIVENPRITTLKTETNKDAICKYSPSSNTFDRMEGTFDGFINNTFSLVNRKEIQVEKDISYVYHAICKARSGLLSEMKEISFTADTKLPLTIKSNTLPYSNTSSITLAIEINKRSQCKYSATDSKVTQGTLFGDPDYAHTRVLTLDPGTYTYYVVCKDPVSLTWVAAAPIIFTLDITPPIMLFVDDSSSLGDNPEYEWRTDRLRAKWLGEDNDTDVQSYMYSIEEFGTLDTIVNWTATFVENEWFWMVKQNGSLNLAPGSKYYVRVMAKNIVGLLSDPMESDGVTIDPTLVPANCSNNVRDSKETDVDCGGQCNLCGENKACLENSDCLSGFCNSDNICKGPTCNDGVANQDETDIDCGGSKCAKCEVDKKCIADPDCTSNFCSFGFCKNSEACFDGILSGTESGIDCGGACPTKCSAGQSCNSDSDCIEGSKCVSGECKICAENDENCNGIPDDDENGPKDTDGDGLPDDWEIANGMDPNDPSDASSDSDKDGLTNLEEYQVKNTEYGASTDPNKADTDGDKVSDKVEIDKGFNPLDPKSKPKGLFPLLLYILLFVLLVCGLGAGAYYYVVNDRKKKAITGKQMSVRTPVRTPLPAPKPITQKQEEPKQPHDTLHKRRELQKRAGRGKLLDIFQKGNLLTQSPEKAEKQNVTKETEPDTEEDSSSVPEDSVEIKDVAQDRQPKKAREHDDDVFRELKKMNKEEFISKVKEHGRRQSKRESLQKLQSMKKKK